MCAIVFFARVQRAQTMARTAVFRVFSRVSKMARFGTFFQLIRAGHCEITYTDGIAEQDNFWSHEGMRMNQTPRIHVAGLENGNKIRGIGEPLVPPAVPALANAIFDAKGQRLREMPFSKFVDFA